MKKYFAEMFGTFVLVLLGCGSAVIAGGMPEAVGSGVGTLGVALAFGLAVLAMVYTIGGISGCHINPAITFGLFLSGKIEGKDAGMYVLFQILGAVLGSAVLYYIATSMGLSGYGQNTFIPENLGAAFVAETVFTMIFVMVVLGATSKSAPAGYAGIAIGLALALIHIVCIPITGTSVNPARSFGPAIFAGGQALSQLWLFIVAPLLGGALAAGLWRAISTEEQR